MAEANVSLQLLSHNLVQLGICYLISNRYILPLGKGPVHKEQEN